MKKHSYSIMAAALLTAGALLTTACSNEDDAAIENATPSVGSETIQFTATLAPKGDDGTTTRAITTGKDANNKEILNVAWTAGEEIAVYYQKSDDTYGTATATVGTPNGDGSAPITATLSDAKNGGTVKFVYPATLHNGTGDIDESILLNQHGNLTGANGISTLYDAATGSSTISTAAGTAVVSDKVTLTNRVCIGKFHFDIVDGAYGPARNFSPIIIRDDNGHTYTITSDRDDGMGGSRGFNRDDDVYIALLPVSGKTFTFYTKYSNHYLYTASGTTLTAGKFYRNLSINMAKDDSGQCDKYKDLRDGNITASDGDIIYQRVNTSATSNTITIPDGATVTLAGVNISATASAGITCSGSANIILEGTNSVTTSANTYPAIHAGGSTTTLTISGSGSLTATGGDYGAGIGGGDCSNIGNITINGGTITANGGYCAAAIGTGRATSNQNNGTCKTITINAGTITANGGQGGAGIGSGKHGKFESIVISDGITSITATPSYLAQAPIGRGQNDQASGSVTVDGVANWAGAETTHLNFISSSAKDSWNCDTTRWTLTHK
jgi:hypothetical protein